MTQAVGTRHITGMIIGHQSREGIPYVQAADAAGENVASRVCGPVNKMYSARQH